MGRCRFLLAGFYRAMLVRKGGHPVRPERKPVSSHAFSTDWRESFVPEPSSHANYSLNLSITWDVAHLKWLTKWWHHCTGEISIDHSIWKYCARCSKFYRQREKNSAILNLFSDLKNLHGRKGKLYNLFSALSLQETPSSSNGPICSAKN